MTGIETVSRIKRGTGRAPVFHILDVLLCVARRLERWDD